MNDKIMYTPSEANEKLVSEEALLVDVRTSEDFEKGHIPGAVNIPEMFTTLSMTTPEGLQEIQDIFVPLFRNAGVRHDQTVIVYEDSLHTRYGGSCRGYFQLSLLGHKDVGVLDGGLSQWVHEGLPVTTEPTMRSPSNFEASLHEDFLATVDDVMNAINDPRVKLLDSRDEDEWSGRSSSPYGIDFAPRKGRIPGARWVEWYEFMDTSQNIPHFKSADEIRAICAQVGLDVNDDIIIYCFKGARAANTYIALKMAGFNRIRNYYGSWNEWSRSPVLPIDDGVLAA
jgi:thiosulfate/3-mercaptopyruvate sulfurtransferase